MRKLIEQNALDENYRKDIFIQKNTYEDDEIKVGGNEYVNTIAGSSAMFKKREIKKVGKKR